MKFRHEEKYYLNYPEAALLRQRLLPIMRHDPHVQENGEYTIRSLYFDDYMNSSYNEKDAGIFGRKKYRIRIYNYSDEVIFFERKIKNDNYVSKQSASLTRRETERIIEGNVGFLEKNSNDLLREIYYDYTARILRPRVVVDYEREPFVMDEGNVRITFDKHIRGSNDFNIFDPGIPSVEVIPADMIVLEVKYAEFMPDIIKRILPPKSAANSAISKFMLCCDKYHSNISSYEKFRIKEYVQYSKQ